MDIQTQHCYSELPKRGGQACTPAQVSHPPQLQVGTGLTLPLQTPRALWGPIASPQGRPSPAYTGDPQGPLTLGLPPPRLQSAFR